jgi:hypothetical protein
MGIKDWFGGDKKKQALRDRVKQAVSDGNLSASDMHRIEETRRELDVSAPADDKTEFRREIYNTAVDARTKEGELSGTGVHELAKIQKFLALRNDQVERTRWDLARLRTLTEIREGNFPTVPASNVALRGVTMEADEVAHYSLSVDLFNLATTRQAEGVRAAWNSTYEAGSVGVHGLPEDGAKALGEATLIITNKRLVMKAADGRVASVRYAPDAEIYLYSNGMRLPKTVGNSTMRYKSGAGETGEIVAELLSRLMR